MERPYRAVNMSQMRKILPAAIAQLLQADQDRFFFNIPIPNGDRPLVISWPRDLPLYTPTSVANPFSLIYDVYGELNKHFGIAADTLFGVLRGSYNDLEDGGCEFQLLGRSIPKHRLLMAEIADNTLPIGREDRHRLGVLWYGTCSSPADQQPPCDYGLWIIPHASTCLEFRQAERRHLLEVNYQSELAWRRYLQRCSYYEWQFRQIDPALRSIGVRLNYGEQFATVSLQAHDIPQGKPGWNRAQSIIKVIERRHISAQQEFTIAYDEPTLRLIKLLTSDDLLIEQLCNVVYEIIGIDPS